LQGADLRDLIDPVKSKEFCSKHNINPEYLEEFLKYQKMAEGKKASVILKENLGITHFALD
jgi:hypothetical protein